MNPLDACTGIAWWKKKRRSSYLQMFIIIMLVCGMVAVMMVLSGLDSFEFGELVFGCISLVLFVAIGIGQLKKYISSAQMEVDHAWVGNVVSKEVKVKPSRKKRLYYITAMVEGREVMGRCLVQTYRRASMGESIVMFTVGTNMVYCVHEDM